MGIFVTDRISLAEDEIGEQFGACARTRRAERQQARNRGPASLRCARVGRRCRTTSRTRLLELAGARATKHGEILINAHRFRTRERNRADALERLVSLVRRAAVVCENEKGDATEPGVDAAPSRAEAPPRTTQACPPATRPGLRLTAGRPRLHPGARVRGGEGSSGPRKAHGQAAPPAARPRTLSRSRSQQRRNGGPQRDSNPDGLTVTGVRMWSRLGGCDVLGRGGPSGPGRA